jgi:predicted GNAT family acetyltransferase
MAYEIEKLNHDCPHIRKAIFEFLAEHEVHALFILGNLRMNFPQTHLYVAVKNGCWIGIAAYYEIYKSLLPFAMDADVTRALTRHVAGQHEQIEYINGIDYVAAPSYNELLQMGYQPDNDPHQVFMEMTGTPSLQKDEVCARPMNNGDYADVARLSRCLSGRWDDASPLAEDELQRIAMNPLRTVVMIDSNIVSTASSNGLGIRCYQILGVATHPDYRGRGYARTAVAALMRLLTDRGGRHAVLFTNRDNVAAQRCYLGLGFEVTGKYFIAKLKKV